MSVGYTTMGCSLLALALVGCAGNGMGLDANGNPIEPGGGSSEPLTADFQSIQDNIFTPICTRCHIGAGAPEGLQLDAAHSYALLVGVPSTEQPSVLRVAAGAPDSSYIIQKLEGASGISGVQMPFGGPYLPQSTIDVVKQWIAAGASKPLATAASTAQSTAPGPLVAHDAQSMRQRFTVASTSPDNDSIVEMVVPNIVIAFNSDVDPSLVNDTNITLERISNATPVRFVPTIPHGNGAAILMAPREPLAPGTYRITLHANLADMDARALGSDYIVTFTVDDSP